uniref:Protein THYLAKOID FORMATION1, chloroplastic-like n=1 Tax=Nelumbo nucifera TaxID=4432 RepID=A0A822XKD3_NELNU|nr:TPA_asm: hypothetical protein HUJ06_022220 [Nelumbo nucifera]
MAAISSLSFTALGQVSGRKRLVSSARPFSSTFDGFRFRKKIFSVSIGTKTQNLNSRMAIIQCMSSVTEVPTVCETKSNFLKAYKRPIPSIYNTVLQELIVQQHLMRYKRTYQYDAVFALGFVTVYDKLMEGYPNDEDREAIFRAYIQALKEDPEQYRYFRYFFLIFCLFIDFVKT